MKLEELSGLFDKAGRMDFSKYMPSFPDYSSVLDSLTIEHVKPDNSIIEGIQKQIEAQNQLASQQISILLEQNILLSENYNKLKEMFEAQEKSYSEAKEDLKRSRAFNAWMMVIAVIAMFAAIAGPIATVWVS